MNKLADAQKANADSNKLLKLNQDIEAIQQELAKARKGYQSRTINAEN